MIENKNRPTPEANQAPQDSQEPLVSEDVETSSLALAKLKERRETKNTRTFHLGDLLSITTGILLSPNKMQGMLETLSWLMNDVTITETYDGNYIDNAKIARKFLFKEFPWLKQVDTSTLSMDWRKWLDDQIALYGEFHEVNRAPKKSSKAAGNASTPTAPTTTTASVPKPKPIDTRSKIDKILDQMEASLKIKK